MVWDVWLEVWLVEADGRDTGEWFVFVTVLRKDEDGWRFVVPLNPMVF